jgi:hypothetical protein
MADPMTSRLRPLTDLESTLLNAFLRFDFDGADELRLQVPGLQVEFDDPCPCGCGSVSFVTDPGTGPSSSASPLPVEAEIVDAGGKPVGGLMVTLMSGRLSLLEVYSYFDPLPLPEPADVLWKIRRH